MNPMKYVNQWISPPKHEHPSLGQYGLDHPSAYNPLHPKMVICIDPNCKTYVAARRKSLIKFGVVIVVWIFFVIILALIVKHMRIYTLT